MRKTRKIIILFLLSMIVGCSGKVKSEKAILQDMNSSELMPFFVEFDSVDIKRRQTNKGNKEDIIICDLEGTTNNARHTYTAELLYKYWDKGGWVLEAADYELTSIEVIAEPKEQVNPIVNLGDIPYDYFNTRWIEGQITEDELYANYRESYTFFLQKEDAAIPYWVEGEVTQIYEYDPYSGEWFISDFYTDNVYQQISMTAYEYSWIEKKSGLKHRFDIVNGPNSFSYRYKDFFGTSCEDTIEIDILSGGYNLKNESGDASLPDSGWCAKAKLDVNLLLSGKHTYYEAIDLVNGRYGLYGQIYEIPEEQIEEAKYHWMTVEKNNRDELFKAMGESVFGEGVSSEWIRDGSRMVCNRNLKNQEYGNVEIQFAASVRNTENAKVGYIIQVISNDGYGGKIGIIVGIDKEGVIEAIEFTELAETSGLGMKAKEDAFKGQYSGKSNMLKVITSGTAGQDEIEAISGATITSKAVTNAVNAALFYRDCFLNDKMGGT